VAGLDPELQLWLVSGNGYSYRVLSLAKGVPTIWEDGELRDISSRIINFGLVLISSAGDMWSGALSTTASVVVIDVESESS
jgi:hypothetical protein